jgi:hypothetical protein
MPTDLSCVASTTVSSWDEGTEKGKWTPLLLIHVMFVGSIRGAIADVDGGVGVRGSTIVES